MAKTVTTRLDDKYLKIIDDLAAQKGVDRSAILRSFLISALKEYTIHNSLHMYESGKVTLWEAAQQCNLSLWEMIREIEHRHIHSSYDLKELVKDLRSLNG